MPIKILVVDNSVRDRAIFKNSLREYCVITAENDMEARRILEEYDGINLLILDLGTNAIQFLEWLKEDERFRKLRTIVLTNHDEVENEVNGLKLGAIDYIRKPVHADSLKARIDVHVALIRAVETLDRINEKLLSFDMSLEQAPIGVAISHCFDLQCLDEPIVRVNAMYEQITGRTEEELIKLGWSQVTHPDDLEEDLRYFRMLQAGEIKSYSIDKRYVKPDGSIAWAHVLVSPLTLSNGERYGHICLAQDITAHKAVEKALNESERSKSVFLSRLPGLAYRCSYDHDWTMQYVSDGCFALTGYHPESLLYNRDLSYNDLIAPEYREEIWAEWARILPHRLPFKYEYEIITATGRRKWVLEMGQGIYNDAGEVEALEGLVLDISERKAIEETLKYNNEHDRWTGLYNREYLVSLLENDLKMKPESRKALIGINLSSVHLLTLNYGFQYSQNLIKRAAEALSKHCADNCILFHARENRFIFYVCDYKGKEELVDLSYTIAETLEPLFVTERIGGGIGILEIDENKKELGIDFLLSRLLLASERFVSLFGKDFRVCFYDEELEGLVSRERDIVEALNDIAVDDDVNDNLFLQFQPIIDLTTGSVFGFEALARLRTEKHGVVPPLEFIPLAEKTKLIIPIGEKIIIKSFNFLKKLKEKGYDDISVSINISIIQLLRPDFTSRLFELMNKMEISQKNIGIEITESIFASDYDSINSIIEELRKADLYVAIDDFGTGYSSLAREKELKADCMKIDKYFVDGLLTRDPNQVITADIISMAHKLGHCTIAEGVEHDIQLQYLMEHGCDKIQGFLFSEPLHEKEAFEFLENHYKNKRVVAGNRRSNNEC